MLISGWDPMPCPNLGLQVYRLDVPATVYSVAPFATVCYSYDLASLSVLGRVWLFFDILG